MTSFLRTMPMQQPWELSPRFAITLTSPVASSDWSWRVVSPEHPAIVDRPEFIRRGDHERAIELVSARYGRPTAHCILGANLACVLSWQNLTFADQYRAVTEGAAVFPCGGMYYLRVTGAQAAQALNLLTPRNIESLKINQAAFAIFTTPEGTVDTEGVVVRDGPESFIVSVGGSTQPPSWLYDALAVCPSARASDAGMSSFNIKGPRRDEAMQRLLVADSAKALTELSAFRTIKVRTLDGGSGLVMRTLIGVELWAHPDVLRAAWIRMVADPDHVTPCGWDVLATYRLECAEMAFYLCPLDINRWTYLHDARLSQAISAGKRTPYVGRIAVESPAKYGGHLWVGGLAAVVSDSPRRVVGDLLNRETDGSSCGFVTTAGWSPVAGRELCFAQLAGDIAPGTTVGAMDGSRWLVVKLPILAHLGEGARR